MTDNPDVIIISDTFVNTPPKLDSTAVAPSNVKIPLYVKGS